MSNENSFEDSSLIEDDVESQVSELKVALENLNEKFDAPNLQKNLQTCFIACPHTFLDKKIFSQVLPILQRFLFEAIEKISVKLNTNGLPDILEDVKQQLHMCLELLDFWKICIEYVSKLGSIVAMDVRSLTESFLNTIKLIFDHCKESSKLYGPLFDGVSVELTNLFRKAKTIMKQYLATLEDVIVFDTDSELKMEQLVKVITIIGSIGNTAKDLDLHTFGETCKTFLKLVISYQRDIKRIVPEGIILSFQQMTNNVSSTLASAFEDLRDGIEEKRIRFVGYLLKMLNKLFDDYCSHLNIEVLFSVIKLLLQMHRCVPSCLKLLNIDEKTIDLIKSTVLLGCEPLLNTVSKNPDFRKAYFEYRNLEDVDKLGYHLLTIRIIRKLYTRPYEQHRVWILGSDSIIDIALTNINAIQEEICTGEVRWPDVQDKGGKPRSAALYEATLVPICSLISQISEDGFYCIELLLLKHLLSNQFWSSLLSADIWCFIGRLGSSELCASQVKYLLKVYASLAKRNGSIEVVVLENLIGRLYKLLSEETKDSIVKDFDDSDNPLWLPIAQFLPSKTKSLLCGNLAHKVNDIPNHFAELQRRPTLQNWNRLTQLLLLIGNINPASDKGIIDSLLQMWDFIANTIEEFEGRELDILLDFIAILLNATRPENVQDDTLSTIVRAIVRSSLFFSPQIKAVTSHYLRNNVDSFGDCGIKAKNALADLNCVLLSDGNPWVRQEALESFDFMVQMCPNEDLIQTMATEVMKKPLVKDIFLAYISRESYYKLRDISDIRTYSRLLAKNYGNDDNVCYDYEEFQATEKLARTESKSSENSISAISVSLVSEDLDQRVEKLCDELNNILMRKNDVGDQTVRKLRLVCRKILEETKSFDVL